MTDLRSPNRKTYKLDFYLDILASQRRETIFQYESFWKNPKNPAFFGPFGEETLWYDFHDGDESLGRAMISNSVIYILGRWIALKKIDSYKKGYILTGEILDTHLTIQDSSDDFYKADFSSVESKDFFYIKIQFDGDYIDYYLEDSNEKLVSYAIVNQEFNKQVRNLIKTNKADYSNIIWPTRADGSMDYFVPSDLLLQNYIPTHTTLAETPLLSENSSESSESLLPEQTPLRWIGKGQEGRIKVLTAEGQEGWVLASSLENLVKSSLNYEAIPAPDIPVPVPEESPDPDSEVAPEDEDQREAPDYSISENAKIRSPLYYIIVPNLPYIVIFIILLLSVILTLQLRRVRKKKKGYITFALSAAKCSEN